jgi:hypothetical protein
MKSHRVAIRASLTTLLATCACLVASTPALAETHAPGWEASSQSYPTNLAPGGSGLIAVDAYNIGGAESAEGATLTDLLPAGIKGVPEKGWRCGGTPETCSHELPAIGSGEREEELLSVLIESGTLQGPTMNTVTVSGGGTSSQARSSSQLMVSALPLGFGIVDDDGWAANADGTIDTQAGSHPFALTFRFDLNTKATGGPEGEARNLTVKLPAGIVGNPTA